MTTKHACPCAVRGEYQIVILQIANETLLPPLHKQTTMVWNQPNYDKLKPIIGGVPEHVWANVRELHLQQTFYS